MAEITRKDYIEKTLRLAEESTHEGYRAKYWELAGKAMGYLEPPKVENQNIAIFQSISGDMLAFLASKSGEFAKIDQKLVEKDTSDGPRAS
jgi:hypothetical protein